MVQNSKIEWTDHTFNPWVGCTKVSPACDHCYAERWAKRTGNSDLWNGLRRRTSRASITSPPEMTDSFSGPSLIPIWPLRWPINGAAYESHYPARPEGRRVCFRGNAVL